MSFIEILMHPVTKEFFAGVQYTAPRMYRAWQENATPRPAQDADAAAQATAPPDFGDEETPTHA
jgi:hypothetical protein